MPAFAVRNEQRRDELIKFSYPFDELSELEIDDLYIGTDLFLDACLYFKTKTQLPVYIGTIDGTYGSYPEIRFIIRDTDGQDVGTFISNNEEETADVFNSEGVCIGVVVFHLPGLIRFTGAVSGKIFTLFANTSVFSLDVCHVSKAPYLRYIDAGYTFIDGAVKMVAGHGMIFKKNADGEISLNIVGTPQAFLANPVKSVNGVINKSIWIAAHPRLNLRLSTTSEGLSFIGARDTA